ncbi:MAG: cell envelope integrity protein CreD [Bacteroidota bacterium]
MQSTTARVIMVGMLTLVLLLPLHYVKGIINERQHLQEEVKNDIAQKWGGSVYVLGPVLKLPYNVVNETEVVDKTTNKISVRRSVFIDYLYIFPEQLDINTDVQTTKKHRSNYEAAVFTSNMKLKGFYPAPDLAKHNIAPENVIWNKATIIMSTNTLKSIKGAVNISFKGNKYDFEPLAKLTENVALSTLQTTNINLGSAVTGMLPFEMKISYDGSERLGIVPIGKYTTAKMAGNWPSPKFDGNFLPGDSTVTDAGFNASWKISQLNRPFAQQYITTIPDLSKYSFDVDFLIPVDEYQQNERASKYGFLVIGLTFLIFFLIQSISKIGIHIFQYAMIGLALIMFYTLLISITEHSSFKLAYLIAGLSVVVMVALYSISILKDRKFPLFIGASLTALYTFIYVIIQLENYALLAGSIGLFFILGAVMYFSRKINWSSSPA